MRGVIIMENQKLVIQWAIIGAVSIKTKIWVKREVMKYGMTLVVW